MTQVNLIDVIGAMAAAKCSGHQIAAVARALDTRSPAAKRQARYRARRRVTERNESVTPVTSEPTPPTCAGAEGSNYPYSETLDSSSSVVVPFVPRPRAAPTDDDDDLIAKIKQKMGSKAPDHVVRLGLPVVRGWLAQGCDLERDVLPELADAACHLTHSLGSFRAGFLAAQVAARRDARLAPVKARGDQGEQVFIAEGTPEWAERVAAGHAAGLKILRGGRQGWWFGGLAHQQLPYAEGPFEAHAAHRIMRA